MKKFLISTFVVSMLLTTNVFAYDVVEPMQITKPVSLAKDFTTLRTHENASIQVSPDLAKLYFNVDGYGDTAPKAKLVIDESANTVKANLIKANLIDSDGFLPDYMSIYPDYKYNAEYDDYEESGYNANASFIVTVTDLDNLNTIIDTALAVDNVSVNSLSFDTTKRNEYYSQALVQAIKNGTQKANSIAKSVFNTSDVKILDISELSYDTYYYGRDEVAYAKSEVSGGDSYNYIPTTIDISANIEMTFGIK